MSRGPDWWTNLSDEEREEALSEIRVQVAEDLFLGLLNRSAAALAGFTIMALSIYALAVRAPVWIQDTLHRFF